MDDLTIRDIVASATSRAQYQHSVCTRDIVALAGDLRALQAEVERLNARPWPVEMCPDCDSSGLLGSSADGRRVACETCGGHEDSRGRGWIRTTTMEESQAQVATLQAEVERLRAGLPPGVGYYDEAIRQMLAAQGLLRAAEARGLEEAARWVIGDPEAASERDVTLANEIRDLAAKRKEGKP